VNVQGALGDSVVSFSTPTVCDTGGDGAVGAHETAWRRVDRRSLPPG
jgi:hypothetical protein